MAFYEVFSLENLPSKFEVTHKLQRWRIFQSWQKFGKNREIAWQFSFSDRFFRKILVKCLYPAKWGKISFRRVIFSGSSFNQANKVSNKEHVSRGTFRLVVSFIRGGALFNIKEWKDL